MVNSAEPMHTNALVRMPAGRRCRSRSTPIAAPSSAAKLKRKTISCKESMGVRQFTRAQRFYYLQLELREFHEMACSAVYLAALQRAQALQPELLHAKAAHPRAVDHGPPQRGITF